MIKLLKKYQSVILYLVFGVLTTLVNIAAYCLFSDALMFSTIESTCIAWFMAVLFAYITNRKWVFESKAVTAENVLKEVVSFFACRLATGVLDLAMMYVCVDRIGWNGILMKTISNILVTALNYIASKWLIFRKYRGLEGRTGENK